MPVAITWWPVPEAETLADLNEAVLRECVSYGSHKIRGREKTVSELFEEERSCLIALPAVGFSNIERLHYVFVRNFFALS